MDLVVAYDIAHPRRLNRVAKIMKDYGVRVQKSIFEVNADPRLFAEMRRRVERELDFSRDGVKYFPLCKACGEVFFASRDSRKMVWKEIAPGLVFQVRDMELIVTSDEQDLLVSVKVLLEKLPGVLESFGVGWEDLAADYTGGTKTMSAALVLALSGRGCPFSYVGGVERDKEGLGIVINGRERMLYLNNPWDELAVLTLQEIEVLFNRCRFRSAMDLAGQASRRTSGKKPFFDALRFAAEAYYEWDNFNYRKAGELLKRAESLFRGMRALSGDDRVRSFCLALGDNLETLDSICAEHDLLINPNPRKGKREGSVPEGDGRAMIADLLANARRRAEQEHRYDDAVARLYSALEKTAKLCLKTAWGIDNSNVDLALLPDGDLKDELRTQNGQPGGGPVRIGLQKSFQVLLALGDEHGLRYEQNAAELEKLLGIRNMSLLAHGFEPVRKETFDKMFALALDLFGLEENELPAFPRMDWQGRGI